LLSTSRRKPETNYGAADIYLCTFVMCLLNQICRRMRSAIAVFYVTLCAIELWVVTKACLHAVQKRNILPLPAIQPQFSSHLGLIWSQLTEVPRPQQYTSQRKQDVKVNWIHLPQGGIQWLSSLNPVTKVLFHRRRLICWLK
jgi:hypothetical protein